MNKKKFYLALVIFSLVGQVAWVVENMYFNVFIYKMFNASASDISLMVQLSAVTAALTTIFVGALSDRIGKRKIFMCLGYILWGISILLFALVRVDVLSGIVGAASTAAAAAITIVIILDCVMTFFGSSANDAAYNAWLTDETDETNRGKAEGINSMMPLVAILVVFGGFIGFDLGKAESWTLIYLIIGGVVLLIGILGFFIVEEKKQVRPDELGYFQTILYGFRPSVIRKNKKLYWTMLAFILFNISIQVFMPYLIIYYEQSLGMKDYVLIMAPAILAAAAATAFYGRLIDKIGFRKSLVPSLSALALGYVMLILFPGIIPVTGLLMKILVFIGSLFMLTGFLTGMAVFGTGIRNETPEGMAGRFQGLRIISQVLVPGVVGPAIGAAVLRNAEMITNGDGTQSFLPNYKVFLFALIVEAVLAVAVVIYLAITRAKEKKA